MRRGLWFAAGAAAGVYGMVRGKRVAEALTVEGMQDRVGALVLGARMFRDEVAQGRADAETEVRARLGVPPHASTTPEITPQSTPQITHDMTKQLERGND